MSQRAAWAALRSARKQSDDDAPTNHSSGPYDRAPPSRLACALAAAALRKKSCEQQPAPMSDRRERNFLEAFLEGGEAIIDLATENEAVKAVPVIGTAVKLLKGMDDMRSRALAAKLTKFLTEPALQSETIRAKLRAGISTSDEEARKVGESLLLVLDRMTDMDKPSLLAKVFVAYLDEVISESELRRIAQALNAAFIDDLLALQDWDESLHPKYGNEWKQLLAGSGLTQVVTGQTYGDMTEVYYQLGDLGRVLHRALWHANHLSR